MPLQASDLGDLVATTQKDLGRLRWTDLTGSVTKYIAVNTLMKKNKIVMREGGTGTQWDLQIANNGSFRFVGLGATDNVNIVDTMIQGSAPWRHATWNWAVIHQEISMNQGQARIVDLVKTRRIAAAVSMVEEMERVFWRYPASTDTVTPYGIAYWIVKNNSTGFNGTAQTGYSNTVAGISTTTYPRWKNYTAQYTVVSKDDLIRKWRDAARETDFKAPVDGIPTFNDGDKRGYYCNGTTIGLLEEALEDQNDNLGKDLASMDGETVFKRIPVTYVPWLVEDTTNPVYGINWGDFHTHILEGEWMRETVTAQQAGQHNMAVTHYDNSFNWVARNRRTMFVLATNTTTLAA